MTALGQPLTAGLAEFGEIPGWFGTNGISLPVPRGKAAPVSGGEGLPPGWVRWQLSGWAQPQGAAVAVSVPWRHGEAFRSPGRVILEPPD